MKVYWVKIKAMIFKVKALWITKVRAAQITGAKALWIAKVL